MFGKIVCFQLICATVLCATMEESAMWKITTLTAAAFKVKSIRVEFCLISKLLSKPTRFMSKKYCGPGELNSFSKDLVSKEGYMRGEVW